MNQIRGCVNDSCGLERCIVYCCYSELEHKDEIYSYSQLENACVKREVEVKKDILVNKVAAETLTAEQVVRQVFPPTRRVPPSQVTSPQSVTAKLFKSSPGPQVVTSRLFAPAPTAVQPRSPPQDSGQQRLPPPTPQPTSVTAKLFTKAVPPQPNPEPQIATSKIFVPRTEDMNKGFLTFSDDESGLTSKLFFN